MAKYNPLDQQKQKVAFSSSQTTKERVRRAFERHRGSLVGLTTMPTLTAEMKRDIELGRPVFNQ